MIRTAICCLLLLLSGANAFADQPKMPVEVIATANDSVGKRLVYFVKQEIQSSSTLSLSINPDFGLRVIAVTLDQDEGNPGTSAAYSLVITLTVKGQRVPYYINQYVGYCGTSKVQECAQDLVASISEDADSIIRGMKAALNRETE